MTRVARPGPPPAVGRARPRPGWEAQVRTLVAGSDAGARQSHGIASTPAHLLSSRQAGMSGREPLRPAAGCRLSTATATTAASRIRWPSPA